MDKYRMELYCIEMSDGHEWNVVFPDVKGCGGSGKTPEDAIEDARINLSAHLEFLLNAGEALPESSNPYENEYSGKFVVRISKSEHKEAVLNAKKEGITLNAYVSEAISKKNGTKQSTTYVRAERALVIGPQQMGWDSAIPISADLKLYQEGEEVCFK